MLKNSIKVVILGVVGFALLVFLTAPKQIENKQNKQIDISTLPQYFQVSNNENYMYKKDLFTNDYLIVLNHDAIAVFNELDKYSDKKILLAANISKAPWLIKKLGVSNEIHKLYANSKYNLIFDESGDLIKAIGLADVSVNSYNIYKIQNGKLIFQNRGLVKKNALQEGISKEEKQEFLSNLKL